MMERTISRVWAMRKPKNTEKSVWDGKRGKQREHKNHRMEQMKVLLKDFVLELPR